MKLHRLSILVVVALTASAVVVPAASVTTGDADTTASQAKVTLTVTVTDNFNSGIANAKILATWDGGSASAQTVSNGKAFIDVEEGATVELDVDHGSYTLNNPVVVEDAQEQAVQIEVFRKSEATVTVVSDGTAIEGAQVVLTKTDESRPAARGQTSADGTFESGVVERGEYTVSVLKEGFLRNETTIEVIPTATREATVAITESTVTVEFSVVDDHFDTPRAIEGASVQIEGSTSATLSTSGGGTATIGLPVNAQFTVTVTKDGYTSASRTVSVAEDSKSLPFTITREDALSVEAVNKRVVVGENVQLSVTDEYGDAVSGADVLVDGEVVGQTDDEGVYRATIDAGGNHTITVQQAGVTSGEIVVEGVSTGGGSSNDATATPTSGENTTEVPLPDLSQPTFAMKIGVAAVGVLLAFLVVRRLL